MPAVSEPLWSVNIEEELTPIKYTVTTTGSVIPPTNAVGKEIDVQGRYNAVMQVELSEPITPEQIFAGMMTDLGETEWSAWEKKELSQFEAVSTSSKGNEKASGLISKWQLSYELPEGADPEDYDDVVVVMMSKTTMPNGESVDTKELITIKPGKESDIYTCDATGSPGSTLITSLLPMEFITRQSKESETTVAVQGVGLTNQRPTVKLDSISSSNVNISNGTATVQIKGLVRDAIADNVPDGKGADIESVRILVNGEEQETATVIRQQDGTATAWRQFPCKGVIQPTSVSFAAQGVVTIRVETAPNAAGEVGYDEVQFSFDKQASGGTLVGGGTISYDFHLAGAPQPGSIDMLQAKASTASAYSTLTETPSGEPVEDLQKLPAQTLVDYINGDNEIEIDDDSVQVLRVTAINKDSPRVRVRSSEIPTDFFDLSKNSGSGSKQAKLKEVGSGIFESEQKIIVYESSPGIQTLSESQWQALKSKGYLAVHNMDAEAWQTVNNIALDESLIEPKEDHHLFNQWKDKNVDPRYREFWKKVFDEG